MRVNSSQVGLGPNVRLNISLFFVRAQPAKHRDDEVHLFFSGDDYRHSDSSLEYRVAADRAEGNMGPAPKSAWGLPPCSPPRDPRRLEFPRTETWNVGTNPFCFFVSRSSPVRSYLPLFAS